jgi:BolA protein
MTRTEQITLRLNDAFDPQHLNVEDESELHRGHAGFQEGGESHFRVKMVAASLAGQSRIAQHRAVHAAIGKQLMSEIHALTLDLSIPK